MRLYVRAGVHIYLSSRFSRADGSASDTSNGKLHYQPIKPIARQSDFREKVVKKKKQRFPKLRPALPNSFTLPYVIHVLVAEYELHSLSRHEAKPACAEQPCLLLSTNPCPIAVHMKPHSTSVFKALN